MMCSGCGGGRELPVLEWAVPISQVGDLIGNLGCCSGPGTLPAWLRPRSISACATLYNISLFMH